MKEVLTRHESLFDGTLDKWKGTDEVKIQLKEGATPYHEGGAYNLKQPAFLLLFGTGPRGLLPLRVVAVVMRGLLPSKGLLLF